jgi:hypothetical protein
VALTARGVQIDDVLRLARADLDDASSQLDQIYEWQYDRATTSAKAIVGLGASLAIALVAAALAHGKASWLPIIGGAAGALVLIIAGIVVYMRVKLIYREYIAAHELLAEALEVRTFLRRYNP